MAKKLQHIPLHVSRRVMGYFGMAVLFFALSFGTISFVHHFFSKGRIRIPPALLSAPTLGLLGVLLVLYFLSDAVRLYCIIRAMKFRIPFGYIFKLVFINIFVSNVTPLATGGGVVQVYFMNQKGIPIGEATAATSIRTMLAALILFGLTPVIIWMEPNLFRTLPHQTLLYGITAFSCIYLLVFGIILFRIRAVKKWVLRILMLLGRLRVLSRHRFRVLFLKISRELDLLSDGFKRYFRAGPAWAALSVIATALFLLLLFSFSVVLIDALGYRVPVLTVLAVQVVVTFFMYFAPTPGAAGVAEGGYGLLFSQLVQGHDITLLTLSWRFLTIYIGVVVGIIVTFRELLSGKKRSDDEP